jgi:hypothetical protein
MAGRVTRPSSGAPLLEKRVGANMIRQGWHTQFKLNEAKWSWPLGKFSLYRDRIEIQALVFPPIVLKFSEIREIKKTLFVRVLIKHDNDDYPQHMSFFGLGLYTALKYQVKRNGLGVKIN